MWEIEFSLAKLTHDKAVAVPHYKTGMCGRARRNWTVSNTDVHRHQARPGSLASWRTQTPPEEGQ